MRNALMSVVLVAGLVLVVGGCASNRNATAEKDGMRGDATYAGASDRSNATAEAEEAELPWWQSSMQTGY